MLTPLIGAGRLDYSSLRAAEAATRGWDEAAFTGPCAGGELGRVQCHGAGAVRGLRCAHGVSPKLVPHSDS
jgi:hypothetical protein